MSRSAQPPARQLREHQLASSIDRFYEAAPNPGLWRKSLQQFSEATGAEGAMLMRHSNTPAPTYVCSEGLDRAMPRFFGEEWHLRNQSITRGASAAQRGVVVQTEWELFDRADYGRDPFHMEFLRPQGFAWFAGLFILQSASDVISVSAQRRACDEPFSKSEVDAITKALPHLSRAGSIALAFFNAKAAGVIDSLSMLEIPAFLLDSHGRVRQSNAGAAALVGNGLGLAQHRLFAEHASTNAALQRLIHSLVARRPANETAPLAPVRVPRLLGQPLQISGIPLAGTARDVFQHPGAILTAVDPDAGRSRSELLLRRAFGLTRAEAATVKAVAAGLDLAEAAARRGVGLETIRSQVKSVASKTGASTRGALVALANRILATTLDDESS